MRILFLLSFFNKETEKTETLLEIHTFKITKYNFSRFCKLFKLCHKYEGVIDPLQSLLEAVQIPAASYIFSSLMTIEILQ